MTRFYTLLIVALAAGCATVGLPTASHDFELTIEDEPAAGRFKLRLRAGASRICMGVHQWPDREGRIDGGERRAVVTTERGRFPARDFNFGYCQGRGCKLQVAPGGELTGFVNYSAFPPDAEIRTSSVRSLEYIVQPHSC